MFPIELQQKIKNRYKYTKLKFKETPKYLDLLLDSKLTWGNRIQELNKKLVKCTGIFSKVRHYLPITCRKTAYNAFIFSRFNFGSEVYLNATKKYINPLIVTQNKSLRILQFKNIRTPLKDLYRDFNILKLKDLHYYIAYVALSTNSFRSLTYCQKL